MSNVFPTNWSVCVSALLSCFHCFSALEIQNIQRASFYDSVSGLHEPPGECIQPAGPPNQKGLKATGEDGGVGAGRAAWEAGVGTLGFHLFCSRACMNLPFHALFSYFRASVWVHTRFSRYRLHIACCFMHSTQSVAYGKVCPSLPFQLCHFDTHFCKRTVRVWSARWCLFYPWITLCGFNSRKFLSLNY